MSSSIAYMTKKEFTQLLSNIVEQKITELFGDLDDNLIMKENVKKRLIRQKNAVAKGERGEDFTVVRKRLGL
ncbi:MAG: hypothetical protein AB1394_04460 [Bacteroidota bacterium]